MICYRLEELYNTMSRTKPPKVPLQRFMKSVLMKPVADPSLVDYMSPPSFYLKMTLSATN